MVDIASISSGDEFGRALTDLRETAGVSIRDLSKRTDIPAATLGGYFTGRHLPPVTQQTTLTKILQTLGVDAAHEHDAWHAALRKVRRQPGRRRADEPAPYRGLEPFGPSDSSTFFGRAALTASTIEHIDALDAVTHKLLFVIGASGSGKSSLLRAGVAPRFGDARIVTPGSDPNASLTRETESWPDNAPELLIVDQFEELFTAPIDDEARAMFIRALLAIESKVVLGMRADFFPAAAAVLDLRKALERGTVIVGPMSTEELRDAIVQPAAQSGTSVDTALVELLLAAVAPSGQGTAAHGPGSLPLISHALLETWHRSRGGRMTVEHYLQAGGIERAVQQTAEKVFSSLSAEEQGTARRMFMRLANLDEDGVITRRRARYDELITNEASDRHILDSFIDHRLLTAQADTVEVSHEALLSAWPRLRAWLESDLDGLRLHRKLSSAAENWRDASRDRSALLRGAPLLSTRDWVDAAPDHQQHLTALEAEFLAESSRVQQLEYDADRARARRLQRLLAVVIVLAVAAFGLAAWAGTASSKASNARDEAEHERDLALSRQVAGQSVRLRASDPALASQLAVAAFKIAPTLEARSAMFDSIAGQMPTRMTGGPGTTALSQSNDGSLMLVGSGFDGSAQLWLRDSAGRFKRAGRLSTTKPDTQLYTVAFSPDGKMAAVGGDGKHVQLWDVADPQHPKQLGSPLGGFDYGVESIIFSPDAKTLYAGGGAPGVLRWNITNVLKPLVLPTLKGTDGTAVYGMALHDGTLVAGGDQNLLVGWDLTNAAKPKPLGMFGAAPQTPTTFTSIAFSPDGRTAAVGAKDQLLRLYDISNATHPKPMGAPLTGFTSWINAIAYSHDGKLLAAGGSDNTLRIWNTSDWSVDRTMPHPGPVTGVVWAPNDSSVITTAADGTSRSWSYPGPWLTGITGNVFNISFTKTGLMAANASKADNRVHLWNLATSSRPVPVGMAVQTGESKLDGAGGISPDGTLLVSGTGAGPVILWDLTKAGKPTRIAELKVMENIVENASFSPDSRYLTAGGDDGTQHIWDVSDHSHIKHLAVLKGSTGLVYGASFSPDGKTIAYGDTNKVGWVWNVTNPAEPKLITKVTGFDSYVQVVRFSPDGTIMAMGSADKTVRLYDVHDISHPTQIGNPITGPNNYVNDVSFSPDGNRLAAVSQDHTVWLWDIATPTEPKALATLQADDNSLYASAFAPDGITLAVAGSSHRVNLWPTDDAVAVKEICDRAGDPITQQEWDQYVKGRSFAPPCA